MVKGWEIIVMDVVKLFFWIFVGIEVGIVVVWFVI